MVMEQTPKWKTIFKPVLGLALAIVLFIMLYWVYRLYWKTNARASGGVEALEYCMMEDSDTEIMIIDCDSAASGELVIPEYIDGYRVRSINFQAFIDCSNLTAITIPEGVTEIVDGAFANCTSLTSISIPESVTRIGEGVFRNCESLTSIHIPDEVAEIGSAAFVNCKALTTVTMGQGVRSIEAYAFHNCKSLEEIIFLGDAPEFGKYVFSAASDADLAYAVGRYHEGNQTWTEDVLHQHSGNISWEAQHFYDAQGQCILCDDRSAHR